MEEIQLKKTTVTLDFSGPNVRYNVTTEDKTYIAYTRKELDAYVETVSYPDIDYSWNPTKIQVSIQYEKENWKQAQATLDECLKECVESLADNFTRINNGLHDFLNVYNSTDLSNAPYISEDRYAYQMLIPLKSEPVLSPMRVAIGPDRPFTKEDVHKTVEFRNGKLGVIFHFGPMEWEEPVGVLVKGSLETVLLNIRGGVEDDQTESPWDALYIIEPDK